MTSSKILNSILISIALTSYVSFLGVLGTITIYKNIFFV